MEGGRPGLAACDRSLCAGVGQRGRGCPPGVGWWACLGCELGVAARARGAGVVGWAAWPWPWCVVLVCSLALACPCVWVGVGWCGAALALLPGAYCGGGCAGCAGRCCWGPCVRGGWGGCFSPLPIWVGVGVGWGGVPWLGLRRRGLSMAGIGCGRARAPTGLGRTGRARRAAGGGRRRCRAGRIARRCGRPWRGSSCAMLGVRGFARRLLAIFRVGAPSRVRCAARRAGLWRTRCNGRGRRVGARIRCMGRAWATTDPRRRWVR